MLTLETVPVRQILCIFLANMKAQARNNMSLLLKGKEYAQKYKWLVVPSLKPTVRPHPKWKLGANR